MRRTSTANQQVSPSESVTVSAERTPCGFSPSPGTPGEGWGGGKLPLERRIVPEPRRASPLPNPPPEYQGRGNGTRLKCDAPSLSRRLGYSRLVPSMQSVILALLLLLCCRPAFSATALQTSAAVEKAKAFLYSHQKNGNWEEVASPSEDFKDINGGQWSGMTAIATYALLCAGEKPTDPRLASAIDFLAKTETRGIYAAGTRCLVWGSLEQTPKIRAAARKDAALLLSAMRTHGAGKGLYYYTPPATPHDDAYDHSVSQFAALGLWTLTKQGFEVPTDFWTATDQACARASISGRSLVLCI